MDKQYLKDKIEALRHNFVESTQHERAVGILDEAHMSKKMLKIKKKMISLEMERCQKKIEHKDCSKIDQKSKNKRNFLKIVVNKNREVENEFTFLSLGIFTSSYCF